MIDGSTLIGWGFKPGKWFKTAIKRANQLQALGASDEAIYAEVNLLRPIEMELRTNAREFGVFIEPQNELERANIENVIVHMDALMRVPTIKAGAIMPDACPAGSQLGAIPVGGVVACEDAIHPGFHSADICCSVAMSVFNRDADMKTILDQAMRATHFGPTARLDQIQPPVEIMQTIEGNAFLSDLAQSAVRHFATQGDGNHFLYVGRVRSTGKIALVTHHGSRSLGALLYKKGMAAARKHTSIVAPKVPEHNAWIKASSREGESYWNALQIVRAWTKANHFAIHDRLAKLIGNKVIDRAWNEHNFVFQKSDGLFYHGKGATPSWSGFSPDDDGRTLIPLNMAAPILITGHRDNTGSLGFAPHGAGRNLGRKAFLRENDGLEAPSGIDIRAYLGKHDPSEFPAAYKDAASVRAQIEKFDLATIEDEIEPLGGIMAGEWIDPPPWKKGR